MYFFWPFFIGIYWLVWISASERPLVDRRKKTVLAYGLLLKFWYLNDINCKELLSDVTNQESLSVTAISDDFWSNKNKTSDFL